MRKQQKYFNTSGLGFKKRLFFARVFTINAASALILSAAAVPMTVQAAEETITFSIPAGDLQKGLLVIANQSRQTISFNPALVANYQAAALNGRYTVRQAILRLLHGSPLLLTTTDNGTLTIVSSQGNDVDAAKANDKTLPAITVTGASEDESVLNPGNSSSALRINTPLQQTAQSVQVISGKLITDRQASTLEEALKNSAGVTAIRSNRGQLTYWMRGYNVTSGLTDGVAGSSRSGVGQGTSVEGIERIEVLKGPQSVLSGSSSPAGTINLVRKKPVTETLRQVKVEAARYGEFKTAIDLGGALTDDKAFSYRLNASTMKSDNAFPDYNGNHSDYLAPVLAWNGDSTRILIGAEISRDRNSGPAGTFYRNGQIQKLPVYRLGDKDDHFRNKTTNAYYDLQQDLFGGWTFNSKANFQSTSGQVKMNETLDIQSNGNKISHPLANKYTDLSWNLQNDIRGVIETGPVKQTLLFGHDYQHERYNSYDSRFVLLFNGNVYNPDSLVYPGIGEPDYRASRSTIIQSGFLLQDSIDLWDRLHVQVSLKRSSWNNTYQTNNAALVRYKTDKWIPNYGVSFDITPDVTVYANYLNSFSGNAQLDRRTGEVLPPATGKSKEVGLKVNLLDDNLTLTTALFDIRQDNVVVFRNGIPVGAEGRKTEGFDVDLNGTLLPGWELTASYTYTDKKTPNSSFWNSFKDTPRHTANIWTSYEIQNGLLQGAGASIGISGTSKTTQNGTIGNYFTVGSQTQTDVAIFYRQPLWSLRFGVNNVFDRDLYYSTSTDDYVGVKDGRTWRLTGTYAF
ncbi:MULTISPECIES: TonB-dependent siderophore receptor [Brenneria]|uniref:TonB-dependent siderophore receptor n=1 Tax=Brenneria nigrifluens DSM 30175 = ATCC 13028 TaxID=1121120 RepID=A0A2U1UWM8_9GAMM|nr:MULTISPECIES: TonB-dependent receptor [Brenneria]EHD22537.1 TonB-dependent siderophore receptor [Brenneria sp. EniD312]PWC26086.1 TonB-dependent siderophore receptor [Brenneria nigrifluens DSM 30175 = ATCC 13028]QCR05530.1 TonB-dependent siderophore receptor [Brenneria nigrifluens DSM 30175 = ATCC 13028]